MKISFLGFKKISWKLTIIYALIFSLVLILLNAAILYGVKYFLVQQSIKQVDSISNSIIEKIKGSPNEQTNISDPELLSEAQSNAEINIRITNPDGKIINESDNIDIDKKSVKLHLNRTMEVGAAGAHLVIRNSEVLSDGKVKAYLQVARDMNKEYLFIELLFVLMAVADFMGIIISVFSGYILSRRILKPIDRITQTVKDISISDLSARIDVGETDDELSRLAITFNEMLERLRVSFEKQNQFVSDASHELRTPISVIQGYIGLMDRWGKDDRNVLQESIYAIKEETASMTELIEKLLFLSRGDNGVIHLAKENIVLQELIAEIIKESKLIAPKHQISSQIEEGIELFADKKMIKQMLRALVDNSIKFTVEGGEINITAEAASKNVIIIVKDTGIGITHGDIDNIFNRFYRVDKARTKETGGSGLGLSIVKWIIEAHNGNVLIESIPEIGTSIRIILPEN